MSLPSAHSAHSSAPPVAAAAAAAGLSGRSNQSAGSQISAASLLSAMQSGGGGAGGGSQSSSQTRSSQTSSLERGSQYQQQGFGTGRKRTTEQFQDTCRGLLREIRSELIVDTKWIMPFPTLPASHLIYVPSKVRNVFATPSPEIMNSDLDAMSYGVLEQLNLTYFPCDAKQIVDHRNAVARAEAAYETHVHNLKEQGKAVDPIPDLRERYVNLDAEDEELVREDLGVDALGHEDLPSSTLLKNPIYTELGRNPPGRRAQLRKESALLSAAPQLQQQQQQNQQQNQGDTRQERVHDLYFPHSKSSQSQSQSLQTTSVAAGGGGGVLDTADARWAKAVHLSFQNARQLDVIFEQYLNNVALNVLGIQFPQDARVALNLLRQTSASSNNNNNNNNQDEDEEELNTLQKSEQIYSSVKAKFHSFVRKTIDIATEASQYYEERAKKQEELNQQQGGGGGGGGEDNNNNTQQQQKRKSNNNYYYDNDEDEDENEDEEGNIKKNQNQQQKNNNKKKKKLKLIHFEPNQLSEEILYIMSLLVNKEIDESSAKQQLENHFKYFSSEEQQEKHENTSFHERHFIANRIFPQMLIAFGDWEDLCFDEDAQKLISVDGQRRLYFGFSSSAAQSKNKSDDLRQILRDSIQQANEQNSSGGGNKTGGGGGRKQISLLHPEHPEKEFPVATLPLFPANRTNDAPVENLSARVFLGVSQHEKVRQQQQLQLQQKQNNNNNNNDGQYQFSHHPTVLFGDGELLLRPDPNSQIDNEATAAFLPESTSFQIHRVEKAADSLYLLSIDKDAARFARIPEVKEYRRKQGSETSMKDLTSDTVVWEDVVEENKK